MGKEESLLERMTAVIVSENSIDSLEPDCVVRAKDSPMRVFEGKVDSVLTFYFHHSFDERNIVLVRAPRKSLRAVNGMIEFGSDVRATTIKPSDKCYELMKNYLVELGLMEEKTPKL